MQDTTGGVGLKLPTAFTFSDNTMYIGRGSTVDECDSRSCVL